MGTTKSKEQEQKINHFLDTPITKLLDTSKDVITLRSTDSLGYALSVLHDHGILSAPVLTEQNHCFGFFAIDDILLHFFDILKLGDLKKIDAKAALKVAKHDTIIDILNRQNYQKNVILLFQNTPLSTVLRSFAQGAQRIGVIDSNRKLIGVLSQSTVISYIAQEETVWSEIPDIPVSRIATPWSRVTKVSDSKTAIEALHNLHSENVRYCPIIDAKGNMINHLSISDFKPIYKVESLSILWRKVNKYLRDTKETEKIYHIRSNASIKSVIRRIHKRKVHQLYLVSDNQPVGLVTLTDICKGLFEHYQVTNGRLSFDASSSSRLSKDRDCRSNRRDSRIRRSMDLMFPVVRNSLDKL
eukprot:TRINITY_DN3674_c0_g1_i1.p1 TRINITY_DN3674_c0_g1~~TRINITY_DN3674_c0_g1_i1.p1  ORF type:complete len:372 (-),score=40.19 TRINITY_DN3674_c0_g1_i1:41-1111(-)